MYLFIYADYPFVIVWPYKESRIHLVNTESSNVQTKAWHGMLEFGCGVGPKVFLGQHGAKLLSLSHGEDSREVVH